jgi:steroid delta-isomerase-like uncharacterized protein
MKEDNVALTQRWFTEVWNNRNAQAVSEFLAADAVMHGISETGGDVRGTDGFLAMHSRLLQAFPDIHFALHDCFGAGDKVAVRWTATMRHTGPGLGIDPTEAEITLAGMGIARFVDGKVAETWDNWDRMTMFQQLEAAGKSKSAGA